MSEQTENTASAEAAAPVPAAGTGAESSGPSMDQMWVPLDAIETDKIENLRGGETAPESLARSVWEAGTGHSQHLISPPQVITVVQTSDDGEVMVDDDDNAIIESIHLVAGFQRVAGLRTLRRMIAEHNQRVADETIGEMEKDETYLFRNGDGVITVEIEFQYDDVPVGFTEATELTPDVVGWAHDLNLAENLARTGLNLASEISGAEKLLAGGRTQTQVSALLAKSQATVSQYHKVASKTLPEYLDAIRDGSITLKQALAVASSKDMFKKDGTPNRTAQKAALAKLTSDKKAARDIVEKAKTKRTTGEVAKFAADLPSDACYTDMDDDRRQAILATLAWFNMGCDENALVYGVTDDIDLAVIPKPKPKKEAKPKKVAAKKTTKKAAKKTPRKRSAKKVDAAAPASEAAAPAGEEAAPAAPAKRKLRRSSKAAE